MASRSGDITENLHALGKVSSTYPDSGPGVHILEAFPNLFPQRNYIISIAFPEFTSLCPVTGQPDFGVICLDYIPLKLCVESKSFKIYMFAFRNHKSFMETITNKILEDMVELLDPAWCLVRGLFAPRGATRIHVFAEHFGNMDDKRRADVLNAVASWKAWANPHAS